MSIGNRRSQIPIEAVLHKLSLNGINGNIYSFIKALYTNTFSNITLNALFADWFPVNYGEKQGDSLSSKQCISAKNDLRKTQHLLYLKNICILKHVIGLENDIYLNISRQEWPYLAQLRWGSRPLRIATRLRREFVNDIVCVFCNLGVIEHVGDEILFLSQIYKRTIIRSYASYYWCEPQRYW